MKGLKQKSGPIGKKNSGRYLGKRLINKIWKERRMRLGKDSMAWLGGKTREGDVTCLCALYHRRGQRSSFPCPRAVKQHSCQPGAAVPSRGRAGTGQSKDRAEQGQGQSSPARLPGRPGPAGALPQTPPGRRCQRSFLLSGTAKIRPEALSEQRLQAIVRAGSSWASHVRLVKHTKDFPR